MRHDVGEEQFRREVMGEFLPVGDTVFYAWSDRMSIREIPPGVSKTSPRHLRKSTSAGRLTMRLAVTSSGRRTWPRAVFKVYVDPDDEERTPLLWVIDEAVVAEADEDDLIDALEDKGYDPLHSAVIGDASGEWQDAERTRGRGSFDWFRKRGWKFIYPPDSKMSKNPDIVERCKVGNALLKSHSGRRRLFFLPSCTQTIRAMKLWEMRNGAAHRRSEFAHQCDAVTYACWRFFPRRKPLGKPGYTSVKKLNRRALFRGY